ncbi:MAG: aldo/keto reductase, partial [Acidobacteriota bacterium]
MTLTRHAKAIAQELAERRVVAQKAEYRDKLQRIQGAFTPPLTNSELSAGLDLKAPEAGAPGQSEVGRFVSASPRLRRVRPDGTLRALIDAVLEGDLLIAVQDAVPGARRAVLICDGRDIRHMGRDWEVRNLAGGPIPERLPRGDESWDDDGLWDLFGADTPAAAPAAESAGAVPAVAEGWTADRSAPWTPRGPLPTRFLNGKAVGAVGLGAMRLSTRGRPDGAVAIAVLHAAWDAGVTLVDTADSYCLDADEAGHNERLIRKALDAWGGDRDRVSIATKAGLIRPGGRWLPDGRPEHLRASCEASLRNLGVEALDLFQLHTPDRRVPFADSVGELARLAEEGKVRAVGLCNIGLPQLDEARDLVTVASVQNGCSYFDTAPLRSGLLERCAELGIPFLAHSPLGGHRKAERVGRDKALAAVAERHGATAHQVALAWLLSLGPGILPLCGATRASSVTASAAAASLSLGVDDLALLDVDKRAAAGPIRGRLQSSAWAAETPAAAAEAPGPQAEAILVMGPPGAGKTRYVEPLVERGYVRLNRDLEGGKLDDLVPKMAAELDAGRRSFVLDNTYPTRTSRRRVLDLAKRRGLAAVGIRIDAPVEEALFNACLRMLDRHGRILSPDEIRQLSKADPNMLPPA